MKNRVKIKQLEDLIVYRKAEEVARDVFLLSSFGPLYKQYILRDQLKRSALSVVSNIAEGYGRFSPNEFRHYLSIANGSAFEMRAQVNLAGKLGYLDEMEVNRLVTCCIDISKMLRGLKRSIESNIGIKPESKS